MNCWKFLSLPVLLFLVSFVFKFSEINKKDSGPLTTITFGSCNKHDKEQLMWEPILKNNPHLWIWLGDIVYGDTDDMTVLKQKYDLQNNNEKYQTFLKNTPIIGIWDDHDYGKNDAGKEYAQKVQSKKLLLDFLGEPVNSPRREREGAYSSYLYGPVDKQVKVILLDSRYFRDSIVKEENVYLPNIQGDILGEKQWQWLEKELMTSKASINIIGNGIQVIPEEHIYEKWANFPKSRKRLFDLIKKSKAKRVILLSGDRHISEISKYQIEGSTNPVYEVTASGLTHSSINNTSEPNKHRIGKLINVLNFGLISIDWSKKPLLVNLEIRGIDNDLLNAIKVQYK